MLNLFDFFKIIFNMKKNGFARMYLNFLSFALAGFLYLILLLRTKKGEQKKKEMIP